MALTCPIPPAAPATTVHLIVSELSRGECEGVCWEPRTCFDHIDGVVCVVGLVRGYIEVVVE